MKAAFAIVAAVVALLSASAGVASHAAQSATPGEVAQNAYGATYLGTVTIAQQSVSATNFYTDASLSAQSATAYGSAQGAYSADHLGSTPLAQQSVSATNFYTDVSLSAQSASAVNGL